LAAVLPSFHPCQQLQASVYEELTMHQPDVIVQITSDKGE